MIRGEVALGVDSKPYRTNHKRRVKHVDVNTVTQLDGNISREKRTGNVARLL